MPAEGRRPPAPFARTDRALHHRSRRSDRQDPRALGCLDRTPTGGSFLGLHAARLPARPSQPPHRIHSRRHPPLPCSATGAEGGNRTRRASGDARHAGPRPARAARQRNAAGGFAGALRRSEIVGLVRDRDDTIDGSGWVEILDAGALVGLRGKTGWREIEIARDSSAATCPVRALERWLEFAKIEFGPIFMSVSRDDSHVLDRRLSDRHVARLVQRTALAAGLRPDLPEAERRTPGIRCALAWPRRPRSTRPPAETARSRLGGDDPSLPAAPTSG
ncbi:mobile element protein [Limimaricola cinnabarinus LL-001]|uniref:Mobile element protein n=1 Tax=Limimaricola cinnabarinus LL-001 TaxID=1337093 RepID=U3ASG2_9RHOB|nr:mobile element protein [Limimaricola cinnabarinus LL-001]